MTEPQLDQLSTSFLGPDRFAFNVEVARILTNRERRQVRAVVEHPKLAHTHFVDLAETTDLP